MNGEIETNPVVRVEGDSDPSRLDNDDSDQA